MLLAEATFLRKLQLLKYESVTREDTPMKEATMRFFSAMGSILDLCPASSYSEYRSSSSDLESISSDWKNVGGYLREAVTNNEQKKIIKKAHDRHSQQTR